MAVRLGDCNGRIGRIPDHQTRSQTSEGSTRSRGFPELGLNDKAHESLRRCGIDQEMVGGSLEKISFSFGKGHGIQSLSKESGSRTRPISGVAGFRRFSFLLSLHFKGGTGQRPFGESALWDQSQLSGGRLPQIPPDQRYLGQAHGLAGYFGGLELDVGKLGLCLAGGWSGPRQSLPLRVFLWSVLGILDRL